MSGQGYGGQSANRFAAFNPQQPSGLMATGYQGGPGQPQYAPNPNNPNQMDMTGFGNRRANQMGAQWVPGSPPPVQMGLPMQQSFTKGYGDGPPPVGMPGGAPPGAPSYPNPSVPSSPGGPSQPPSQPGMQPGQYAWLPGFNQQPTPRFGASQNLYINHMLHGSNNGTPPAWASQVDPNNLMASIGQLSGVQYDPNSPLWKV